MPNTFNRDEEPNHASDAAQQLAALQLQLAESEAKFSAIFHHSSAFMSIVTEAEAKYVDVNQTSCEVFGVKREDVIGRTLTEFDFYAEPAQRVTLRELLTRDGYVHDFEVKWKIKTGEVRTHLLNAERITINGQACLFVVSNDITEQKQTLYESRENDERMRLATEATAVGIWEWNVITDQIRWDAQMFRIYGVVPTQDGFVPYRTWSGSVLPEDLPQQEELLQETVRQRGHGSRDFRIRRNDDGEVRYLHTVETVRINAAGQVEWVVGTNLDITGRKRHESNLAFLADISKDFAPLSSVAEIMELAGERAAEYLKLSHCLFTEINEAADEAIILYDHHAPDAPNLLGVYRLAKFHTEAEREQLSAGKLLVINDVGHEPRLAFAAAEFESLGIGALVTAPYHSGGKWKFALSAQHKFPYQWREDECELLDVLAAQVYVRIERARIEAALRESEERFRALFDSIDEGFCIIEMIFDENNKPVDYRFVQANPAMERLTGLKDVIGKTIREMVPDLEEHWFEFYGNVALTGEAARVEGEAAAMNRWFEIYASRVGNSTNRVAVIFNNITERKDNEARLHASEIRYRRLFETAKDGILILDSTTAKITNANPYIGGLLGFSHAELIGKELWEIGLFKDIEESKAAVRELQAKKYIRYEDLPLETKTGRRADVEFISNVYQENGHTVIQCNIRDITERKHAEAERERLLAEAQRLRAIAEDATRAKDEFLAVVSHELRNPLNSMLGYARLMRANPHDAAQVANYAEVVERNARMQQQLIEDLLDTARIISGKLKIETAPTDLRLVLADALAVVRPAAEAKQIELRAALGDEPQSLLGDAARLQQVAWNLLQNAIKFTPARGCVEVRLEKTADDHLCLIVSDTGKGIEPEFQSTIFDRFTQQDMSSTRRHGGLGLGLTLAKQLVELHGGTIGVTSPGRDQGSTFTVKLPQRTSLPAASAHNSVIDTAALNSFKSLVRLDGLRLLVVDDQEEARQLLTHFLREGGASVTAAESGLAALALLEQQLFDLLVCDIAMPDMDGYEVLRRLREQNAGSQRLPAIALTAHSRPQDRLRALAAGFQMHIAKPVEPEELIAVIASLTGRL